MSEACLVIDDQPMVRRFVCAVLSSASVASIEAANANEALILLENRIEDIKAVICDVNMPGEMNGVQFGIYVRHTFPALPILLISGDQDADDAGEFDCMYKPFSAKKLLDWVQMKIARTDQTFRAG